MKQDRRNISVRLLSAMTAAALFPSLARAGTEKASLTRKEVKELIANAKTPSEHRRIAAYYRDEAENLTAKQREHEEDLVEYYKRSSQYSSKYPTMGDHCRELAGFYATAARKAQALADMHEQMAKQAEATESGHSR